MKKVYHEEIFSSVVEKLRNSSDSSKYGYNYEVFLLEWFEMDVTRGQHQNYAQTEWIIHYPRY